ncbi:hypothetical protein NtRootA1_46400 [Arthrobacter sp. NtRootA1]|nr:hypothetical protein NtRootA1_46400 [Arthrobacter sp. NtRootA1]
MRGPIARKRNTKAAKASMLKPRNLIVLAAIRRNAPGAATAFAGLPAAVAGAALAGVSTAVAIGAATGWFASSISKVVDVFVGFAAERRPLRADPLMLLSALIVLAFLPLLVIF